MTRSSSALRTAAAASLLALLGVPAPGAAQYSVFRSHQSANLATTETLRGGNWLFEISHRFQTPIEAGSRELWGVDGPAWIRLGLSWAPTNGVLVGVVRTNNEDNLELNARWRFLELDAGGAPVHVAVAGGGAWNTDPLPFGAEDNEFQAFAQLVVNTVVADRLALGLSPTLVQNPRIHDADTETTAAV